VGVLANVNVAFPSVPSVPLITPVGVSSYTGVPETKSTLAKVVAPDFLIACEAPETASASSAETSVSSSSESMLSVRALSQTLI